mmetsp:Transcript_28996/g.43753  ORF Transcript_28996/g.43753 Transcript_28996/m.43753 type:complete len:891 (-) Transcript_28996:2589-5261(-)
MSLSTNCQSKLRLHGAAANSTPHSLLILTLPHQNSKITVYASSGIINLISSSSSSSPPPHVTKTLRTKTTKNANNESLDRVITSLCTISSRGIGCAFSDGTITTWWYNTKEDEWKEQVIVSTSQDDEMLYSITDLDGILVQDEDNKDTIVIVSGAANGVSLHTALKSENEDTSAETKVFSTLPASTVKLHPLSSSSNEILILMGTALPRFNKIGVYTLLPPSKDVKFHGYLLGHQDWITSFDILPLNDGEFKVASGSKDAKIRLWNIHAPISAGDTTTKVINNVEEGLLNEDTDEGLLDAFIEEDEDDSDDEEQHDAARLQIISSKSGEEEEEEEMMIVRNITLEALLIGHEETITSVSWRPFSSTNNTPTLMSSSMDRTILLWTSQKTQQDSEEEEEDKGVWMPMTRLGAAGGILGGSIGSSLLGFVDAAFLSECEIVGHGYGGSLHFFHSSSKEEEEGNDENKESDEEEKKGNDEMVEHWDVQSNITGHFRGVVDLDWEVLNGDYLLTVGYDQTCRLWAQVPTSSSSAEKTTWHEVGRPQVHGYDLTSITCIGYGASSSSSERKTGGEKKHRFVSGADEKLLRVFDAPSSTLRLLRSLRNEASAKDEEKEDRVERAYIPSLGLSNKAEAKEQMEEVEEIGGGGRELAEHHGKTQEEKEKEKEGNASTTSNEVSVEQQILEKNGMTNISPENDDDNILVKQTTKLPNERDLGVTSLWPEVGKLYGHYYEISCLTCSSPSSTDNDAVLVASACKARDVEHASIRLWNVNTNSCVEVLTGGHKSTVVTLSFSSDNKYLASSGKDRRLCIWQRHQKEAASPLSGGDDTQSLYKLAAAVDSAHKRIVWSVDFCPLDPTLLASGARDGAVRVWKIVSQEKEEEDDEVEVKEVCR